MKNKIFLKTLIIILILIFSFTYTNAGITVTNGSFESGLANWTVSTGTDFDRRGLTTDGNQLIGVISTYDMNVQNQTLAVFAYEHRSCGGSVANCHTDVLVYAGNEEVFNTELTRGGLGGSQRVAMNQFCGTVGVGDSGILKFRIAYLNTSTINTDVNYTHSSQNLSAGDRVCFWGEGDGDASAGNVEGVITVDNFQLTGHTLTTSTPVSPAPSNVALTFRATITDVNGSNIANADVNILLNGDENVMVFSEASGQYLITFSDGLAVGDYLFDINSTWEGVTKGITQLLQVRTQEFQYLTVTAIENISNIRFGSVDITPSDNSKQIIFKVDSNSASAQTPTFKIFNSRFLDEQQYFIFTSPDGNNFVFNDTLTFGSDETNPIQKIWSEPNQKYTYSFQDTLTANETKYYKMTYRSPYKHFFSINNSSEWSNQLQPTTTDDNSFSIDTYSISQFANIRSTLIQHVPGVFGDETSAFELQFTAFTDVNGTAIDVGQTVNGSDVTTQVSLTSTPHTFSFTINATDFDSQVIILTTNNTSANVTITDYAIVARGFFTKRLKLFKENTDPLDVFLLSGFSKRYLQEGIGFRIDTEAFDREGILDTITVSGFLDGTGANNLVKKSIFNIGTFFPGTSIFTPSQAGDLINFNQIFPPIIDLNGTANNPVPPRTLIVRTTLTDKNGTAVAVQSRNVTFLQFPYFPNDLIMNFFPTEKRKGKHPTGLLQINIKDPNILQALDFRIYSDGNTLNQPNFRTTIFKGQDFSCTGTSCNLELKFNEFVFEDVNLTTITVFAILNTEYLDQDNNLTRIDRRIFVVPIEFDIAKIYQVVHRTDRTYRESEEIPLVLILRDDEATNLKNKLDIFMTLQNCDNADGNAGNCVDQTIRYKPTGFVYDDKANLNYYFFRHLFVLDNGSLLPDGNYISFRATVTDKTGTRSQVIPVLTDKCKNNDIDITNFFAGILTGNIIGAIDSLGVEITGCNTEQENIVTTTKNSEQEHRLLIDEDHTLTSPTQEVLFCLAPDTNNVISKPLEQDLICGVWYTVGEKPIDNFRVRITNHLSDLSIEGSTKQYKEWNIPYEIIAINDIQLLKLELQTDQTTSIDTVGDFFYEIFNGLARDFLNSTGLQDKANFIAGKGIITNVGADLNFNKLFSPTNITGAMIYRVKGIPVTNIQDFKFDTRFDGQFENVNRKQFLDFLAINNIPIPEKEATLEVIVSDLTIPLLFKDSEGSLIIDEKATNQAVSKARADVNANLPNQFIPNILTFTFQNTMFFNNFSEQETRSLLLRIALIVVDSPLNATIELFNDFAQDPAGTTMDFLFGGILFIAILMMLVFMVSLIWRNFNNRFNGGNGGN